MQLVEPVEDPSLSALSLNSDLAMIKELADQWLIKFNPNKFKSMIFSVKRNRTVHPPLRFSKYLAVGSIIPQTPWCYIDLQSKLEYSSEQYLRFNKRQIRLIEVFCL